MMSRCAPAGPAADSADPPPDAAGIPAAVAEARAGPALGAPADAEAYTTRCAGTLGCGLLNSRM
jgi:hypothetical protein